MTLLDREIVRLLMLQVREEQHSRESLVRALIREDTVPIPIPTDAEVDARIQELEDVAKSNLTKRINGGNI